MNMDDSGRQIRAWTAVGAMSVEAILDRFDRDIINNQSLSTEELNALETACSNNGRLSKAEFSEFVVLKSGFPDVLKEAADTLFESLCYLSTTPLQATSPPYNYLTLKTIRRALMWLFPDTLYSTIPTTSGYRERSPADHRRLVFQSLATLHEGQYLPLDPQVARLLAADNARSFPKGHRGLPVEDADINFDNEGDEMYHDVLDFLASTQPHVPPTYAEPCRDSFRSLANRLHKDAPALSDLAIPRSRLEAFISLLLATNLRNRAVDCTAKADLELQGVAQSMAACFHWSLSLNNHMSIPPAEHLSVSLDGSTWPMFNFAVSKLLPYLFESLYSLLSMVLFDHPCRFDANTGYVKPGTILTRPRMVQLESFLFNSISIVDICRFESEKSASGLVKVIKSIFECALLVIHGHTAANETHVLGFFIARPPIDGPCIQEPELGCDETALLFQLSPTHDVFRGKVGAPAWSENVDGLTFGDRNCGAALTLDGLLATAQFTNRLIDAKAEAIYSPAVHRGNFELSLFVDDFEVWGERV